MRLLDKIRKGIYGLGVAGALLGFGELKAQGFVPNDPEYNRQKGDLSPMDMEKAWRINRGSKDIIIGVNDVDFGLFHEDFYDYESGETSFWINKDELPGVDKNDDGRVSFGELLDSGLSDLNKNGRIELEDLYGSKFENGVDDDGNGKVDDFVGWNFEFGFDNLKHRHIESNDVRSNFEESQHGLGISGVIGARNDNGVGIAGISNCKIMVLTPNTGRSAHKSLEYGIEKGINVLNMSVSYLQDNVFDEEIFSLAKESGIVIVAGSGNNGRTEFANWPSYPCNLESVICVGGVDVNGNRSVQSSYGGHIDFAAPTRALSLGRYDTLKYGFSGGTSNSSAYVSGIIGLMMSVDKKLTFDEVIYVLKETSDKFGENIPTTDYPIGIGRVNAGRALEFLVNNEYGAVLEKTDKREEFISDFDVRGIANGDNYKVDLGRDENWIEIGRGVTDENGYLATVRIRNYEKGDYELRLEVGGWRGVYIDQKKIRLTNSFFRGDCNYDGNMDMGDPLSGLFYTFGVNNFIPKCLDACDVNDDGKIDVTDAIYSLNFIFMGGNSPKNPFPNIGGDTTEDNLGCYNTVH
jgi:hypothetical protein